MTPLHLPWLAAAPGNFSAACRALRAHQPFDAVAFRRMATSRLNLQQLTTLARALPKTVDEMPAGALRLSVLSNATTDLLLPAIAATAPRHDLWFEVRAGAFGTYAQEAMDLASPTHQWHADFVLLALDYRAFDLRICAGDEAQANSRVDAAINSLFGLVAALQRSPQSAVLVQTLVPPLGSSFGHLERQLPGSQGWLIDAFNRRLRKGTPPGLLLLDLEHVASEVGIAAWHDPALWALGKFPCSQEAIPLYAEHVCRLVMAARGKSKKCLVLDLDNTLWGGVIGDDGMAGIVLGQGSAVGEAHLQVQAAALALHDRGVVLAVSSKNEDATARQVFREHPDMLLREKHIAAFQANWQDKASNLVAIAKALNIGVDALVLLDDNPAERQQVRLALPEVGVPELPEGAEEFADILLAAGYFETVQFTAEDAARAAQYQANAARSEMLGSSNDLDAHLAALDMSADFTPFDAIGRARITQLINKTNQFNLSTKRRSEAEVAALEQDTTAVTLQVRLKDRFGDNGMISVVIAVPEGDGLFIDTWLMSCRVLNRGVEGEVLNTLVTAAKAKSLKRLIGEYLPTPKNALVQGHYSSLGFQPIAGSSSRWTLDLADYRTQPSKIRVTGNARQ